MHFPLACALMATVSFVAAQTTEHLIMVGMGGLTFNPSNITANPGDVIAFQFMAKNHSATQTTFATPCSQLVNSTVNPPIVGISSGFMPVPNNTNSFPQWRFAVTDTAPLWFMCAQANHCQQGMVFSVNANANKTFDQYLQMAKASTQTVLAPQTNGAQTPSGSTGSSGSTQQQSPVAGAGNPIVSAQPNGSPVSGTSAAPAPSKSGAASPGLVPATGGMVLVSIAAIFGAVL